ncbi:MAG: response regulator [Nitrospirales bacterium]
MAHHILIIDDSADIRWMLSDLLESKGYHCEQASNAIDALSTIQNREFDLILTDYQMPKMDGIEFLQNLATMPRASATPVIMITATSSDALTNTALTAGACAVLTKPVHFDKLLFTITQNISQSESQSSDTCYCT